MSRAYEMEFTIFDYEDEDMRDIQEVIEEAWDVDDEWRISSIQSVRYMTTFGRARLCGGETEEAFVQRIQHAIWHKIKKYVKIEIDATCLEYIPIEHYESRQEDYDKFRVLEAIDRCVN